MSDKVTGFKHTDTQNESIFEKRERNMMKWVSYWKLNPHRFVEDYMGINLMFFQKIIIYMMNIVPNVVYIAARSQGKSFLTAIFVVMRCILYPGTRIVISSYTKKQSALVISEKIVDLYNNYPAIRKEIGDKRNIKTGNEHASVEFLNGSSITTATASKTGRGKRANVLVVDEYALVDKEVYQKVLRPMAGSPRIPRFKERYPIKYASYMEPNMEILLSSARYKNEWSWDAFSNAVDRMTDEKNIEDIRYFGIAVPYQVSIIHGLLSREKMEDDIENDGIDKLGFKMEYDATFVGENEGAFFSLNAINNTRNITKAFIPPTDLEYIQNAKLSKPKNLSNMPKQNGEIRLVGLDVAIVGGKKNDTSAFMCMRLLPNKNGSYKRHLVRIETVSDATTDTKLAIRLKQLYYDFEADYAILDTMGIGDSVYTRCAEILYDKNRDIEYDAWESINNKDMRDRIKNKDAKQVIYTIKASAKFNNDIATQLRSSFENGKIQLLINDIKARDDLIESGGFRSKSQIEQQRMLSAYQQTTALVNELIELQYSIIQGGNIQIKEVGDGTKDRYSSLAYTNYIANELEIKEKNKNKTSGYQSYINSFRWKRHE